MEPDNNAAKVAANAALFIPVSVEELAYETKNTKKERGYQAVISFIILHLAAFCPIL